ncbi:MAG: trigger factor [Rickettsiaceae bacterium]|nr:trigger factor [Rickettsiaceae bacterium]
MNITEISSDQNTYHAHITIPSAHVADKINHKLIDISKTAKMDGFRVGKVPFSVIEKKYSASVRGEIIKEMVESAIQKVIDDKKLNILLDPQIEDFKAEDKQDIEFTAKFDLMPEIKIPNLSDISLEKPVIKVTKKDIDERLQKIAEYSQSFEKEKDGAAAKGDQVTLDAVGYVDGVAFEGGKLNAHKLILGSKAFVDNFEDQLIGAKVGDEILVKVKFPENYSAKNLAGKLAEFQVQILAIHSPTKVKIDDELAQKLKFGTLKELCTKIEEEITRQYEEPIRVVMKMKLFDELEKLISFVAPKALLEKELNVLQSQKEYLVSDDAKLKNMSETELKDYFTQIAKRRVNIGLLLTEYAKVKKISITEEDLREVILQQVRHYPGQEMQIIEYYQKNQEAVAYLKGPALEEKAVKNIFDNEIKLTEKVYTREELENLLSQHDENKT